MNTCFHEEQCLTKIHYTELQNTENNIVIFSKNIETLSK